MTRILRNGLLITLVLLTVGMLSACTKKEAPAATQSSSPQATNDDDREEEDDADSEGDGQDDPDGITGATPRLTPSDLSLKTGESKTVKIANGTKPFKVWSENEKVVTVSVEGRVIRVTASGVGETKVEVLDEVSKKGMSLPVQVE